MLGSLQNLPSLKMEVYKYDISYASLGFFLFVENSVIARQRQVSSPLVFYGRRGEGMGLGVGMSETYTYLREE
jgi:hypothetical protein